MVIMGKRCKLKGGSLKEAVQAIFRFGVVGKSNEWYVYECNECGKWHIVKENKIKQ